MSDIITISATIPGHGTYQIGADELDQAIGRYLPASPATLRAKVEEAIGLDYSDVTDVSALLIVLADIDAAARRATLAALRGDPLGALLLEADGADGA
jgi:hypothetical protein